MFCITSLLTVPVPLIPASVQFFASFSLVVCGDDCVDRLQVCGGNALDTGQTGGTCVSCSAAQPFYLCVKVANTFYSV